MMNKIVKGLRWACVSKRPRTSWSQKTSNSQESVLTLNSLVSVGQNFWTLSSLAGKEQRISARIDHVRFWLLTK